MMNRRNFTFSSLALALAPLAHGADAPSPLTPRWTHAVRNRVLDVGLEVLNPGDAPVMVLMGRRSHLGAYVRATPIGDDRPLESIESDIRRSEMMSRTGPVGSYEPVAPAGILGLGRFLFALPDDVGSRTDLRIEAFVNTRAGELDFAWTIAAKDLQSGA